MIFRINTTSDILKLLYVISRAVSDIYAKYHVQIMLLFVCNTTRKGFVIFTCRYFKYAEMPLLLANQIKEISHVLV